MPSMSTTVEIILAPAQTMVMTVDDTHRSESRHPHRGTLYDSWILELPYLSRANSVSRSWRWTSTNAIATIGWEHNWQLIRGTSLQKAGFLARWRRRRYTPMHQSVVLSDLGDSIRDRKNCMWKLFPTISPRRGVKWLHCLNCPTEPLLLRERWQSQAP